MAQGREDELKIGETVRFPTPLPAVPLTVDVELALPELVAEIRATLQRIESAVCGGSWDSVAGFVESPEAEQARIESDARRFRAALQRIAATMGPSAIGTYAQHVLDGGPA